ncbi:MAG: MarR family transcriptional regulator [Cellvibrio sp.]
MTPKKNALLPQYDDPQLFTFLMAFSRLNVLFAKAGKDERYNKTALSSRSMHILARIALGLHYRSDIAEFFNIAPSVATFELDRLSDADLIRRHPDPKDKRRTLLILTPGGVKLCEHIFGNIAMLLGDKWKKLNSNERDILVKCIDLLAK